VIFENPPSRLHESRGTLVAVQSGEAQLPAHSADRRIPGVVADHPVDGQAEETLEVAANLAPGPSKANPSTQAHWDGVHTAVHPGT
jgi:hypothetical protein